MKNNETIELLLNLTKDKTFRYTTTGHQIAFPFIVSYRLVKHPNNLGEVAIIIDKKSFAAYGIKEDVSNELINDAVLPNIVKNGEEVKYSYQYEKIHELRTQTHSKLLDIIIDKLPLVKFMNRNVKNVNISFKKGGGLYDIDIELIDCSNDNKFVNQITLFDFKDVEEFVSRPKEK